MAPWSCCRIFWIALVIAFICSYIFCWKAKRLSWALSSYIPFGGLDQFVSMVLSLAAKSSITVFAWVVVLLRQFPLVDALIILLQVLVIPFMNIEICKNWLYPWHLRRTWYLSYASNNDSVEACLKLTMRSLIALTLDSGKKRLRNLSLTSSHVVGEWCGCELNQSVAPPPSHPPPPQKKEK